jgi:transposase
MQRYELSKDQYEAIEDLLPMNGNRGGHWKDHRNLLNGMFWVLYSGAHWREMPERYGSWKTVYDRFSRWSRDGTIEKMLSRLHLKLDESGYIDMSQVFIDSTVIRASRSAAGAKKSPDYEPEDHGLGMSRGCYGSKIHLTCDKKGVPLSAKITADKVHDSTQLEKVLERINIPKSGKGRPKVEENLPPKESKAILPQLPAKQTILYEARLKSRRQYNLRNPAIFNQVAFW